VTRRADYLAANAGLRAPMPGFVLLVRPRGDGDAAMRVGITVSGKVGGAVVRNRMKRRFRELARAILPQGGIPGADHILIGRKQGIERPYDQLQGELRKALAKLASKILPGTGRGTSEAGGGAGGASRRNRATAPDGRGPSTTAFVGGPPPRSGED
jgi:ribonuclease P protein component